MKIRSLMELEDQLDRDLAWRRKEFTTFKLMVSASRKHEKELLLRSSVTLLYAHWEGHIKFCAQVYILYLKHLAPNYSNMKDNFIQMSLGERFKEGFSIKKFPSQKEVFDYIKDKKSGNFNVNESTVIDTESNLKYSVFYNILSQLGLNSKPFELKENFIDSKMLRLRNAIAHGEKVSPSELEETHSELEKELLSMIETFQNMIRNAASNKEYLKQPTEAGS